MKWKVIKKNSNFFRENNNIVLAETLKQMTLGRK